MCLKLSNFKMVPLFVSHSRYKALHLKLQGEVYCVLYITLKYVYVRQSVVILQAWAFSPTISGFDSLLGTLKSCMAHKVVLKKKFLIIFLFYFSFSCFRFMNT
jgi:hypothetical protein